MGPILLFMWLNWPVILAGVLLVWHLTAVAGNPLPSLTPLTTAERYGRRGRAWGARRRG